MQMTRILATISDACCVRYVSCEETWYYDRGYVDVQNMKAEGYTRSRERNLNRNRSRHELECTRAKELAVMCERPCKTIMSSQPHMKKSAEQILCRFCRYKGM